MRVFVFSAMKEEIESLLEDKRFNFVHLSHLGYDYYKCFYKGKELVLSVSGIGRVASAMFITALHEFFRIQASDVLINIGSAGGISPLKIGDCLAFDDCVYGDANVSWMGNTYRYGQMAGCPFNYSGDKDTLMKLKKVLNQDMKVCCMTNEMFTTDLVKTKNLLNDHYKDFNVLAFDMESAAYAQAAYKLGLRFCAVRFITDIIGSENQTDDYINNNESGNKKSDKVLKDAVLAYLEL